jgi:hypothetical protein
VIIRDKMGRKCTPDDRSLHSRLAGHNLSLNQLDLQPQTR